MNEETESTYAKLFRRYLRSGLDAGLEPDADGGHVAPRTIADQVITLVQDASPLRRLASVASVSSDDFRVPEKPNTTQRTIYTHELYAQPTATQKLVDDAAIDVEGWLASKIADIFARTQNTAFMSGNGVGQPTGILHAAESARVEQVQLGAEITSASITSLFHSLGEKYRQNAAFIMNSATREKVRDLREPTTGNHLWMPGMAAGAPDTLLGVPVHAVADMPFAEPGKAPIALGDFRLGYQIIDRIGIRIIRDPFTEKPFVRFYATARVGGEVVDEAAIKVMRLAA
jgi:HK97 family phage major capsid protein